NPLGRLLLRGVGRVDTEHVHAGLEQTVEEIRRIARGPERRHNFGIGHKKVMLTILAFMPILQVIILALVQGITEFLPISSTAHLALAPWLLGWKDAGLTFDIALHVGTLVAVLLFFFRDWLQVIAQGFGLSYGSDAQLKQNRMLLWFLAAASIPLGVVGFIVKDQAEEWRNPFLIGGMLIAIGLVMWLAERAGSGKKSIAGITLSDSLAIGAAQALA